MGKQSRERRQARLDQENEARMNRITGNANGYAPTPPPLPVTSFPNAPASSHVALIDAIGETVERATAAQSIQPRFQDLPKDKQSPARIFDSVYKWINAGRDQEPKPNAGTRAWDAFYRTFPRYEPYLIGVLNSVIQIDINRTVTFTGGRNQVKRGLDIWNNADDGAGSRPYVLWQSRSFYETQMGFVTETLHNGEGGPLLALYSMDSTRCELTGKRDMPLTYYPEGGNSKPQPMFPDEFFRDASLRSIDETQRGYGFPAIARAYELAKVMVGVWQVFQEALLTTKPKGAVVGKNISEDQWRTSLMSYNEVTAGLDEKFVNLMTIMSAGDAMPEFAITLFRRLPEGFDLQSWTSLLMYGYALAFGFDAREFFPVSSGQLGTATETKTAAQAASSKGNLDFAHAHEKQLQRKFPATLQFAYEQRDAEGKRRDAELAQLKTQILSEKNKWVGQDGKPILTDEQFLQLAADEDAIHFDWTIAEEDVTTTDMEAQALERYLGHLQTQIEYDEIDRAIERGLNPRRVERVTAALDMMQDQPLVRYDSRTGRMVELAPRMGDVVKRLNLPGESKQYAGVEIPVQVNLNFNAKAVAREVKAVSERLITAALETEDEYAERIANDDLSAQIQDTLLDIHAALENTNA